MLKKIYRFFIYLFISSLIYVIIIKLVEPPITITQLTNAFGLGLKRDYVSWNDPTLRNIELIDFQGQSILKQRVSESRVSVENLNSGIYLLLLSDERNTFVRKISIIR